MRLIDADALIQEWYRINNIDEDDRGARFIGYTEIPRFIANAPTVSSDAVSSEEYEETDGVITIEKQSAKDVGEIKHIVIHSPNYTRYFYNESMPTSAEAVHKPDYSYEADMVKRLRAVQEAQATQRWIPCSERLPSENGDYLCTIPLDAEETYTEVLMFHKGRFYEDDAEWGATYHDDVLAWMPLPTPYKGGDE